MAYQSRVNACRVNTTYTGLYMPEFAVLVNGTAVTVLEGSFSLELRATPPHRCRFALRNTTVSPGHAVDVRDGGAAGKLLFSGRVVTTTMHAARADTQPYDEVEATDTWLLNRYDVVRKDYYINGASVAVNGIVNDILTSFSNGYHIGDVDEALVVTDGLRFQNVTVLSALQSIATAVSGFVVISPHQSVSIVTTVTDGHTITLDNSATDFWGFTFERDIRQIRNQVIVEGTRTRLSAEAQVGNTEITVDDATTFSADGGFVAIGNQDSVTQVSFTTKAITEQEDGTSLHQLTGITGLARDHPIGTDVVAIGLASSSASQTTLASTLGGGLSGQAQVFISDPTLANTEADLLAANELAQLKDERSTVRYTTSNKFTVPIKTATVSLTTPRSLSATLRIETVRIRPRGAFAAGTALNLDYKVTATPTRLTLTDVLTKEL